MTAVTANFILLLYTLAGVTATHVVELDLVRLERRRVAKRDTGAIGLGDALDITYNVLVQVGGITTPLVLDTGSADLWVLSDKCSACSGSDPLYPSSNFKPIAEAQLLYGDSRTGTHAFGEIGADRAGVAGLVLDDQYFAAISDTNTSVLDTGSAGIFGLGFPVNSLLWNKLYTIAASNSSSSLTRRRPSAEEDIHTRSRSLPSLTAFSSTQKSTVDEEAIDIGPTTNQLGILSSFAIYGPLVSRLVLNAVDPSSPVFLESPQFSVTLQRTIPSVGGNVGSLALGALPSGVDNASLTWIPVRRYTPEQDGVVVPEAPEETYPYAWDVPLDAVYFDGVRLPRSALGSVSIDGVGHSALIDSGNSLIRGPADTIIAILSLLINSTSEISSFEAPPSLDVSGYTEDDYTAFTSNFDSVAYAYPCAEAHSLVFEFSGTQFQVDPRDFGRPVGDKEAKWCAPNFAPTDPPELGNYLYSWSLGEPFLRSVLATFYYGNLTRPSLDPPRIGFLSTVPSDAEQRLAAAVYSAKSSGGYFETTVSAPTGSHTKFPVTTDAHGVIQASEAPLPVDLTTIDEDEEEPRQENGASPSPSRFSIGNTVFLAFGLALVATSFLV